MEATLALRVRRLDELRLAVESEWKSRSSQNQKVQETVQKLVDRIFGKGEIERFAQTFRGAATGETFQSIETYASLGFELDMMGLLCDTCVTESENPKAQRGNMLIFPFANPDAPLDQPILYGGTGVIAVQIGEHKCLILRGINPSEALLERATAQSIVESQVDYIWERAQKCGFDLLIAPVENRNEFILTNRGPVRSYIRYQYPGVAAEILEQPKSGELIEVKDCPGARFNNLEMTPTCVVLRAK